MSADTLSIRRCWLSVRSFWKRLFDLILEATIKNWAASKIRCSSWNSAVFTFRLGFPYFLQEKYSLLLSIWVGLIINCLTIGFHCDKWYTLPFFVFFLANRWRCQYSHLCSSETGSVAGQRVLADSSLNFYVLFKWLLKFRLF